MAKIIRAFRVTEADIKNAEIAWNKQEVYGIVLKHPLDAILSGTNCDIQSAQISGPGKLVVRIPRSRDENYLMDDTIDSI